MGYGKVWDYLVGQECVPLGKKQSSTGQVLAGSSGDIEITKNYDNSFRVMDREPGSESFHDRTRVTRRESDEFIREGWEEVFMDSVSFKGA